MPTVRPGIAEATLGWSIGDMHALRNVPCAPRPQLQPEALILLDQDTLD
jgi:hypothetical protein